MGFTLSEVYSCEPDEEALKLIGEFASMVKWWAERAHGFSGRSYTDLRKAFYAEWTARWPSFNRQLIHTSASVASSKLQLQRRPEERPRHPDVEVRYAVLHPKMLKVAGNTLRISVAKGAYAYVELLPKSSHCERLLRQTEDGLWQLGQAVLTEKWIAISFTCEELDDVAFNAIEKLLKE